MGEVSSNLIQQISTLQLPRRRWDQHGPACQHRACSSCKAGPQRLQQGEEVRSCKCWVIFSIQKKYESLHVGGLMLGNQVNGWGHWGFRVGGLLGKAGHNNNIGGVLPDQLDSNTSPSKMQANAEGD